PHLGPHVLGRRAFLPGGGCPDTPGFEKPGGAADRVAGHRSAGGTIQNDWPIEKAFTIGDQGSGTQVLTDLYEKMKNTPVHVDLAALWREMGIESRDGKISFYDHAPFAAIRRAITTPRKA